MAMEPHEAIIHLKRLLDEIDTFQRVLLDAGTVRHWYGNVLETLSQIYGQDSNMRREFEQIRFGFPPETFQRGAELLEADLQKHGINLPEPLSIPLGDYYQRPLREAKEFLSSCIVNLKGS
jgi:hypothetical protein